MNNNNEIFENAPVGKDGGANDYIDVSRCHI